MQAQIAQLEQLMTHHADFEEVMIHRLLKKKGSTVHASVEAEQKIQLEEILACPNAEMREYLGYRFYLAYRLFFSENLKHFHDEELRLAQWNEHRQMTPDQIAEMIAVLTPHINPSDRHAFIEETKDII